VRTIKSVSTNSTWEEIMSHLILQGDDTTYPGFSLLGETSLAITMDEQMQASITEIPPDLGTFG
jgi:hypothetical protein